MYKTYRLCRFYIASWSLKSDSAVKVVLFVLFNFIVAFLVVTSPFLSLFLSTDFITVDGIQVEQLPHVVGSYL